VRQTRKVRLLISSKHPMLLDGLKLLLHDSRNIQVLGEAETLRETTAKVARLQPDALLLDIPCDDADSLGSIRAMKRVDAELRIFALSLSGTINSMEPYRQAGVSEFVFPGAGIAAICKMLEAGAESPKGKPATQSPSSRRPKLHGGRLRPVPDKRRVA
jgi:DNA-binding NarL/FixJ family response regulator